ncbi:type II toxin-antitoxin system Phd/YefM family antitoxin [Levilactobacillus cerevisiae]|uniref:type II toxin-antitoxin system Phd/YefM family antitoxin n=1 Tax=Levilactobacillus cerevisiae TaxID=1704076 RepID=UPI000F76F167|nr:type II toxin-antitoxin system Phd/YefM family antitoxin [Levilactobacillus cerevisiae]
MTLVIQQSDFCEHVQKYLDCVTDDDKTIHVARPGRRAVVIVSQQKMSWLEAAVQAKKDSLEYAVARDQLIKCGVLADDEVVEADDRFWNQFKN